MTALGTFLFAFVISYVGTHLLLRVRVSDRFIDVPGERSSHDIVKPRLGGIALVSSFFLAFAFLLALRPEMREYFPLIAGAAIIFAAGLLDDRGSLPVTVRLAAQIIAALVVVGTGNVVDHIYVPLAGTIELDVLSIPFTILFVLTSINFYNFIDGIDGLAAGSASIVGGFLALIAYMLGQESLALICLAVAGASLGFLQFNFPPSRLFMGDSGSTFLGFFFAFAAISGNRHTPELPFFITALLLSSLYLDASATLLRRLFRGEKIFRPHRTHYYQRLLALGFNHKQVTVLEYGLTALLGASAVIFFKAGGLFPVFLCVCWLLIFTSLMLKVRGLERGDRAFFERRTVLVVASDVLLVAIAYFSAFFLRLGFQTSGQHWDAVVKAFPIVFVVRSSCFYWYGLYRGVWKYTSTPDIVRIIKAVTVGSAVILMLLVFFYRFKAFPRSMFVMEYFLLILGLAGTRFASRLFHEFGKDAAVSNANRVAIVGAGDEGEQLLREVRTTGGKRTTVVCFIDDDRGKDGLTLQGIPITGPISRMKEICEIHRVDTVLVAKPEATGPGVDSVIRAAREAGIAAEAWASSTKSSEPAALVFDRLSRGLERTLPLGAADSAQKFYCSKRVLVTNGGGPVGPALVRALMNAGAAVIVHVPSEREGERMAFTLEEAVEFRAGALVRENDIREMLDAAGPDVVFHAVGLRARGIANEFSYTWQMNVRSCEAICNVLEGSRIESLVIARFWDTCRTNGRWAVVSAVGETLVLNAPGLDRSSPKMIRIPAVLTEGVLTGRGASRDERADPPGRFALLEPEVVSMLLNAGSAYAGRAIIVPAAAEWFEGADAISIVSREPGLPSRAAAGAGQAAIDRPLFAGEMPRPSVIPGVNEVVSPLYPASDALMRAVKECAYAADEAHAQRGLVDVAAALEARLEAGASLESPLE
jgi:UDP-GlcNAc:undecaprenyl-phosphate GlcNAc-1-phosphate transferase